MFQSQYTGKFHTQSFYIGHIRAAVEEFQRKHGGLGDIEVVCTHMGGDFTAQGHAESRLDGVIAQVEIIAYRRTQEAVARMNRNAFLRQQLADGLITEEEFDREMCFA